MPIQTDSKLLLGDCSVLLSRSTSSRDETRPMHAATRTESTLSTVACRKIIYESRRFETYLTLPKLGSIVIKKNMGKEEKEKASDKLDKDDKDQDEKKEEKEEEPKGPVYTGEGFIPIQELIDIVKAWQQRKVLCEEVDLLEAKGGTIPADRRHALAARQTADQHRQRHLQQHHRCEESRLRHQRDPPTAACR